MRNLIQIQKQCEWCGKEFTAYRCSTRFCSKQCTAYAYKTKCRKKKVQAFQEEINKSDSEKKLGNIPSREYLTPTQTAQLLGIGRATLYRYLLEGSITAIQFKGKTLIRKQDIDKLFDSPNPYQKRQKKEQSLITEFYTTAEVEAQFGVCASWVFKVGKEEHIPKVFQRGKTLWSKKHFDAYFAKKASDETITEWLSVEDIKSQFDMTTNAVYTFVSKFSIPKKKVKREVFYSKKHVEWAKGIAQPEEPQYYTVKEAMEKYDLTRDQLYHYVKRHHIPKVQEGKYVKISRKELDALLAPPVL